MQLYQEIQDKATIEITFLFGIKLQKRRLINCSASHTQTWKEPTTRQCFFCRGLRNGCSERRE